MNEIRRDMLSRSESTTYPIQGDGIDWYTGFDHSDNQLLVVRSFPTVVALSFRRDGDLQEFFSVPGFPSSSSLEFSDDDEKALQNWFDEIGFRLSLIRVKRFHLNDYDIAISDLPEEYREALVNPTKQFPEDREVALQRLDRWSKVGLFVLRLNEFVDLWIDGTGQVQAS
jgi:hypothetical protein